MAETAKSIIKVLFVCQLNHCRSPLAQAIFQDIVLKEGLGSLFWVDSAGISAHDGTSPDLRVCQLAAKNNIDMSGYQARCIKASDFDEYDIILAIDSSIKNSLLKQSPATCHAKIRLLLDYDPKKRPLVVPGFDGGGLMTLYQSLECSCSELLSVLRKELK